MRYFIFLFIFFSCYELEKKCNDFHTGVFEFSSIVNGEIKTSKFIRTSNLEVEVYNGKVDSASIRWVNDCEFILTKLDPTSNQDKRPVRIEILSTKKAEYFFEYSLVNDPEKRFRGKAKKIDEF